MTVSNLSDLDTSRQYSYAEYLLWQFRERVELIRGRVFKMSPAPGTEHQKVSRQLSLPLFQFFDDKQCQAFAAPFDVRLPQAGKYGDEDIQTVVQPDLCVICDEEKIDARGCVGAPDLVIEILSPGNSKKEMRDKYNIYEEAGVREYWLVNPSDKVVLIYILSNEGRFIGLQPLTEDQAARSTIFPDLSINLHRVFNA